MKKDKLKSFHNQHTSDDGTQISPEEKGDV